MRAAYFAYKGKRWYLPMTIRHLKVFMAVYENGSITRAAAALHLTQPAVTRAVKDIESYYGIRLFDRINHKLYVTAEGEKLYAGSLRVMEEFRLLEEKIGSHRENFTVNIGSTFSLGIVILPQVLSRFRERFPKAEIRGHIHNASTLKQMLLKNEIDFAMYEDENVGSSLSSEYFFEDCLVLLLHKDHPLVHKETIFMEDLVNERILAREKGSNGRRMMEELFFRHEIPLNPVMESSSTTAILKAVVQGVGVALLPCFLVAELAKSGAVVERSIADADTVRGNCLVWVKERCLPGYVRRTMDLCKEIAAEIRKD